MKKCALSLMDDHLFMWTKKCNTDKQVQNYNIHAPGREGVCVWQWIISMCLVEGHVFMMTKKQQIEKFKTTAAKSNQGANVFVYVNESLDLGEPKSWSVNQIHKTNNRSVNLNWKLVTSHFFEPLLFFTQVWNSLST